MKEQAELELSLDSFDARERREALVRLAAGAVAAAPEATNVNMHFHSFFSYNAEGYSPSRIAWEARKAGLYAAGLCDFDVLDGLEEFIRAGCLLSLRTAVHLETRAFLKELADVDISSPGEPGVTYIMGAGFAREWPAGMQQAEGLAGYRQRARARNVALIQRINRRLPDIAIAYDDDVLPLTPSGAATERHIVSAYLNKAYVVFEHADRTAAFWAQVLGKDLEETIELMADLPSMEEAVRSRLAKRGGLGYEPPSANSFPSADEFIRWVVSCEAIPMLTWLDGTSAGEKDPKALLECMTAKGVAAVNIIPDRNWNFSDPARRAVKTGQLEAFVRAADAMGLPINIGTEMNKLGLPFADELGGPALKPYRDTFLKGARIMVGHTLLLRYAGFSYIGPAAGAEFRNIDARNRFFEAAGRLPPMNEEQAGRLDEMGSDKALAWFRSRCAQG